MTTVRLNNILFQINDGDTSNCEENGFEDFDEDSNDKNDINYKIIDRSFTNLG